jgi:hypothetical protein
MVLHAMATATAAAVAAAAPPIPVPPRTIEFAFSYEGCNPGGGEYALCGCMDEQIATSNLEGEPTGWGIREAGVADYFYLGKEHTVGDYDACYKRQPAPYPYARDWSNATFLGLRNVSLWADMDGPSYGQVRECEHWGGLDTACEGTPCLSIPFVEGEDLNHNFAVVTDAFLLPEGAAPVATPGQEQKRWPRLRAVAFNHGIDCEALPCTNPNDKERPWDGSNCSTLQLVGDSPTAKCSRDSLPQWSSHLPLARPLVPALCDGCDTGCALPSATAPPVNCVNVTFEYLANQSKTPYQGPYPTC